jgi:GT2 family glycosyltransferase
MGSGGVVVAYIHPTEVAASFHKALLNLMLWDAAHDGLVVGKGGHLANICASGRLAEGRNQLTGTFLDQTKADWLWMVDADMGFAPDTVSRLVAAADKYARPVVGGLCFGQKRVTVDQFGIERFMPFPTIYQFVERDDRAGWQIVMDYPRDQLVKVAGTGAACLLIHRRVLEQIRTKVGDHWWSPITHPKGTTFSEDLSFCVRLAAVDQPLYVDTRVKTSHHKNIYLDEVWFDTAHGIKEAHRDAA